MEGIAGLLVAVIALMFLNGLKLAACCCLTLAGLLRGLGFLFVCVPVRAALAIYLPHMAPLLLLLIGVAFYGQYLSRGGGCEGGDTGEDGDLGFFGGVTWWARLRPVHPLMYVAAGVLAYDGKTAAAQTVLLADVLLGLVARLAL